MKFLPVMPPIPFQFVNDSTNETIVGPQMRATSKKRDADHEREDDLVPAGQQAVTAAYAATAVAPAADDPAVTGDVPHARSGQPRS